MTLSKKAGFFALLLIAVTMFLSGCGDDSKTPRKSTAPAESGNSAAEDSEGSTVTLTNSSNSTSNDNTGKTSGGSSQFVVQFAKGSTSKSFKNTVGKGGTHTYVVNVSAGQSLTAKITSAKNQAYFRVKSPGGVQADDGQEVPGFLELLDHPLKESGNYKVTVYPKNDNVEYTISISVTGGTSAPSSGGTTDGNFTKTVKFGAGKSSATYSAKINGDDQTYVLGANSGQTMTVNANGVDFTIYSPGGSVIHRGSGSYTGTLPSNGNYRVSIDDLAGKVTSYSITFAIR